MNGVGMQSSVWMANGNREPKSNMPRKGQGNEKGKLMDALPYLSYVFQLTVCRCDHEIAAGAGVGVAVCQSQSPGLAQAGCERHSETTWW